MGKAVPGGEYGNRLECTPSLDLPKGAGSVRTGEVWFDFRSMGSRFVARNPKLQVTNAGVQSSF